MHKIIASAFLLLSFFHLKAQYTDIYDFQGQPDGANPMGSLVRCGKTYFGMTSAGGANGAGYIFSASDSGGYVISSMNWTHSFGVPVDGLSPDAALIKVGNKFFGTTSSGGANGSGAIFSINMDGRGYTLLYSFGGVFNDGQTPTGSLLYLNGTLYGTASAGGLNSYGILFSIDTNGTGYTDIYDFTGNYGDGDPHGALINLGTKLYGMTTGGMDAQSFGNIFSINPDGSSYTNLYQFGDTSDGGNPNGSLTYYNGKFYGMTNSGGNDTIHGSVISGGTIFSIDTAGTNYTVLLKFQGKNGYTNTGETPNGSLVISGNVMYGTTVYGGLNAQGDIFSVHTDGTSYHEVHSFNGNDGSNPEGDVALVNGVLYACTVQGAANGYGNLVSVKTDSTGFTDLIDFTNSAGPFFGAGPFGSPLFYSGNLYGTASSGGGASSGGTVFLIDTSGQHFNVLHIFGPEGASPNGSLIFSRDSTTLFGMTNNGGKYGDGNIFSIDTAGNNYTDLYDFQGQPDGANPLGTLTLSGGGSLLYGMTSSGGTGITSSYHGTGTIFCIHTDGTGYQKIYDFPSPPTFSYGAIPTGSLVLSKDTSRLFGVTVGGGTLGHGNIFSITTNSIHTYTDLLDLPSQGLTGTAPSGALTLSQTGDTLYGVTTGGGANNSGTIFSYNNANSTAQEIFEFGSSNAFGGGPLGPLTLSQDQKSLYGVASYGGANGMGAIFWFRLSDRAYIDLYDFDGTNGQGPNAPLLRVDSSFYGMANGGGANGYGVIFNFKAPPVPAISVFNGGICPGDSFNFKNQFFQTGDQYYDTLSHATASGGDSIILLNLTVYPQPTSITRDTICSGSSVIFNGHAYSTSGYHNDTIRGAGSYGCDSIATLYLKLKSLPYPNTIAQNGPNALVSPTIYPSYQWFYEGSILPGDTGQTLAISQNGDYRLIVYGVNGCSDTSSAFNVITIPTSSITKDTICSGSYYLFNGSYYNVTGSYADTMLYANSNGYDSIAILHLIVINKPSPVILRIGGDSLTTNAVFSSYQWFYDGTNLSGDTSRSIVAHQAGSYSVLVYTSGGCFDTSLVYNYSNTGINVVEDNNVVLYPNPNSGQFIIQVSGIDDQSQIEIYSYTGQKVFSGYIGAYSTYPIEIGWATDGVYLYHILSATGNIIGKGKFIIQK